MSLMPGEPEGDDVGVVVHFVTKRVEATDPRFTSLIRAEQWRIASSVDLSTLMEACGERWPAVVVVDTRDLEAPEIDAVVKWLRLQARIPVVAVTAAADVETRLMVVRLGVDDDAVDPVDPLELFARISRLVRRSSRVRSRIVGDLIVDRHIRRVVRRGTEVTLTPSELTLLDRLLVQPGLIVTKEELLLALGSDARTTNAVEVHVSSLRRKLHQVGPPIIHTVHGRGYVLRPVPTFDLARRSEMLEMRERVIRQREDALARRDRIIAEVESRYARGTGASPKPPT
jgi:DNA-binding response OmpR family regulator